jgi:RNA polymerase-interacting CarD/CdnL/TRCF family regulator
MSRGLDLDVGSTIRYRGLGAAQVVEHVKRPFAGEERTFAVLSFPHSDLNAQVPVGDEAVSKKIEALYSKSKLEKLLRTIPDAGDVLPRTWDAREEIGRIALQEGGPEDWVMLVASYALAEGSGVSVAASDEEMLRKAQELLAAELSCVAGKDFNWGLARIDAYYKKAMEKAAESRSEPAEHFAAVKP